MGGGDVKLLAALGALAGPQAGLEVELLGMCFAAVYGLVLLARRGALGRTLVSSLMLVVNLLLPPRLRRPVPAAEMMPMRLGVPLFLGTVASVVLSSGVVT
jgi:prepilin peptidase CpaA